MRNSLLLLLLALPAGAQTLPEQLKDPTASEVAEYLDQQIRKNKAAAGSLSIDNSWSGAQTFGNVNLTGTTNITGSVTGSISTWTYVNVGAGTTNATSCHVCVAGSTVSFTVANATSTVEVSFSGNACSDTSDAPVASSFLINGRFPVGLSATVPVTFAMTSSAGRSSNVSFSWMLPGVPGTGTVTGCLVLCNDPTYGGTMTFPCHPGGLTPQLRFSMREVK